MFYQRLDRIHPVRFHQVAYRIEEGCLEAREGVVIPGYMWLRQMVGLRVTEFGKLIYPGSSRVRQSKHFGTFIERLTCCVVNSLTDNSHTVISFDLHYLRVTARDEEAEERE